MTFDLTLSLTLGIPPVESVSWTSASDDNTPTFRVTVTGAAGDVSYLWYSTDPLFGVGNYTEVTRSLSAGDLSTGYYDYTTGTLADGLYYVKVKQGRRHPSGTMIYSAWSNTSSQEIATISTGGIVLADVTIPFGRTTISGAGGFQLVPSSGAITGVGGTNALSGTNSTHFAISATGMVTPTASFVSSPQASYTLTATVYGDSATPDTATLTINTTANSWSFRSMTELAAIIALGVATLSGKTAYGRNVEITGLGKGYTTLRNLTFTSQFTIESHDANDPVVIKQVFINNCKYLWFKDCRITLDYQVSNQIYQLYGASDNCGLDGCNIGGPTPLSVTASGACPSAYDAVYCVPNAATNFTVLDCDVHDCYFGLQVPVKGDLLVKGNRIYRCNEDFIKCSTYATNQEISWNELSLPLVSSGGHPDMIQFNNASAVNNAVNIIIRGNILYQGACDNQCQGIFMSPIASPYYFGALVEANTVCLKSYGHAITIYRAIDCTVRGNTFISLPGSSFAAWIVVGQTATSGTQTIYDNIHEEALVTYGSTTAAGNLETGLLGATVPFNTIFDGPTFAPTTLAEVLSQLSMKVGGAADGASYNAGSIGTGYFDFNARTYTAPR